MLYVILGVIVVCIIIIWLRHRTKQKVKALYSCNEGTFQILGSKSSFKVKKGKRFEFSVVNGQIVSYKDKMLGRKTVYYTEDTYGTHR